MQLTMLGRQIHIAEPLVPARISFGEEIAIVK
jgi:hypothetical protein